MTNYSFEEHAHRYGVWTAARAVARGFTNTQNIEKAIEAANLIQVLKNPDALTAENFELKHKIWCNKIMENLKQSIGMPREPKSGRKSVSYGLAAKIVAMYCKTTIILPNKGKSQLCTIIHPPIDSILLKDLPSSEHSFKDLKWTLLDEKEYWELIAKLKNLYPVDWRLEAFWSPSL